MSIGKLINAVFGLGRPEVTEQSAAEQGDIERRKRDKDSKLVDVAHEAMRARARDDQADLEGLVKMGWPHVQREKFRSVVREKVGDHVQKGFGTTNSDMVDEITDSIVNFAEADPKTAKIFGKDEA